MPAARKTSPTLAHLLKLEFPRERDARLLTEALQ
jgi:hypothetical protein